MFGFGDHRRKAPVSALLLIPAVLLLACCASQQKQSEAQAKEDKEATAAVTNMTAAMDDAKCRAFGYQPSSPQYFRCRDHFDAERNTMGFTDDVAQNPKSK